MAWADNLLEASFRGVVFDIERVSCKTTRAVAVHEVPFQSGAKVDDLGLQARRFSFRAIFWGPNYELRRREFMDALEQAGPGELVHPIDGTVSAVAVTWDDEHEAELVDGSRISVELVEHTPDTPFERRSFVAQTDAVSSAGAQARAAADDAVAERAAAVPALNFPRITVFRDLASQARSVVSRLVNTTGLRVLLSDLDVLLHPRAYVADLRAIVDRALQGLPFGGRNDDFAATGLAVQAASTLWGDWNTAAAQLDPAGATLTPAVALVDADMAGDAAVLQANCRVHLATGLADAATIVLEAELQAPSLSRAELEAIANRTRAALQAAIEAARAALDAETRGRCCQALREAADAVQEAARAAIARRPPLVRRQAPVGGPARLVAHVLYGDATRAPELVQLNRLGRKVLLDLGDPLEVYSA